MKRTARKPTKAPTAKILADSADSNPDCQRIAERFGFSRVVKVCGELSEADVVAYDRSLDFSDTWPGHKGGGFYGDDGDKWIWVGSANASLASLLR